MFTRAPNLGAGADIMRRRSFDGPILASLRVCQTLEWTSTAKDIVI
jgi:hypothetical protein